MSKWQGYTAEQMNYRAEQGLCSEQDLIEWAETQNKHVVSIEWVVRHRTRPMPTITNPHGYMRIYYLLGVERG